MSSDDKGLPSVPFPDNIFSTTFLGEWTGEEIIAIATCAFVIAIPVLLIPQIPTVFIWICLAIGGLVGIALVIQSPPGQPPLDWLSAWLRIKMMSPIYVIKPGLRDSNPVYEAKVPGDSLREDINESHRQETVRYKIRKKIPTSETDETEQKSD